MANIAVSGNGYISETAIENNPNNIHCAVLDSHLAIDDIKRYFDSDGWAALQQVVEIKRINPTWICKSCNEDSSNNSILGCFMNNKFKKLIFQTHISLNVL